MNDRRPWIAWALVGFVFGSVAVMIACLAHPERQAWAFVPGVIAFLCATLAILDYPLNRSDDG